MTELELQIDRRWALRRGIELDADVTNETGQSFVAKVTDISEEGCGIHSLGGGDLVRERLHTIKVVGLRPFACYVVWSREDKAGLMFSEPLHPATIQKLSMGSLIARLSQHTPPSKRSDSYDYDLSPFPFD